MSRVQTEIEFESRTGHIWKLIADGSIFGAEPDVGIMFDYIDDIRVFWSSGKEFSKSAYKRIPECLNNQIDQELLEAAGLD